MADGYEDWSSIELLFRIDHLEEDVRSGHRPRAAAETTAAVALRRSLTPDATYYLMRHDGAPRACIGTWVDETGLGVIEDVFVHPDYRGRGFATGMLRHAVAQLRSRGAGHILIGAEPTDTPKHLYAKFGFRPAAVTRAYLRSQP